MNEAHHPPYDIIPGTPTAPAAIGSPAIIDLPPPDLKGSTPLMIALARRQSLREFAQTSLSHQQLSDILWAADGINRADTGGAHRTVCARRERNRRLRRAARGGVPVRARVAQVASQTCCRRKKPHGLSGLCRQSAARSGVRRESCARRPTPAVTARRFRGRGYRRHFAKRLALLRGGRTGMCRARLVESSVACQRHVAERGRNPGACPNDRALGHLALNGSASGLQT